MRGRTQAIFATGAVLAVGAIGAATALGGGVVGGDDDGDVSVSGPQADAAVAAALRATGGGHANAVERDGEDGATWEVEVTKPDGQTVDVRLGADYAVVVIEGDHEDRDGADDGDD